MLHSGLAWAHHKHRTGQAEHHFQEGWFGRVSQAMVQSAGKAEVGELPGLEPWPEAKDREVPLQVLGEELARTPSSSCLGYITL